MIGVVALFALLGMIKEPKGGSYFGYCGFKSENVASLHCRFGSLIPPFWYMLLAKVQVLEYITNTIDTQWFSHNGVRRRSRLSADVASTMIGAFL